MMQARTTSHIDVVWALAIWLVLGALVVSCAAVLNEGASDRAQVYFLGIGLLVGGPLAMKLGMYLPSNGRKWFNPAVVCSVTGAVITCIAYFRGPFAWSAICALLTGLLLLVAGVTALDDRGRRSLP